MMTITTTGHRCMSCGIEDVMGYHWLILPFLDIDTCSGR